MIEAKVWCTNLLCRGRQFNADITEKEQLDKQLKEIICIHCGNVGVMPYPHVLNTDEMLRQILAWRNVVLYKNAFKTINYRKMPKNMEQQKIVVTKKEKATKPIKRC